MNITMHLLSLLALCVIYLTVSLPLADPFPTSTDTAVLAAYSTYAQTWGPDLSEATQDVLEICEDQSGLTNFASSDAAYEPASNECLAADNRYQATLRAAAETSAAPASSTQPPAPNTSANSASASTASGTTPKASATTPSKMRASGAASTSASTSAKAAGAAAHMPARVLGGAVLLAVLFAQ
ncbi:hypothetical protein B0H10DRAFT_2192715 [Mycena sp. CBHHK59/15]|nr:hypothetical protein B0H10DRAFT_2192715 [Mycena sp. CBHHK59/15]